MGERSVNSESVDSFTREDIIGFVSSSISGRYDGRIVPGLKPFDA